MNTQRWAYEAVIVKRQFWTGIPTPEQLKQTLNDMGQKGWELMAMTMGSAANMSGLLMVFKRPI